MSYVFENKEELARFIREQVVTSSQAQEILEISRTALNSLVQRGKLKPIIEEKATKLFFRSDVEARKVEADKLRKKYRPYE